MAEQLKHRTEPDRRRFSSTTSTLAMATDYAHWHGMYEVAERFYQELIPQVRELAEEAEDQGNQKAAETVEKVIEEILDRPEHQWFEQETLLKKTSPADQSTTSTESSREAEIVTFVPPVNRSATNSE